MDYCFWQWLREEPTVTEVSVALTSTGRTQILPGDPMRFMFSTPGGFSSDVQFRFGESGSNATQLALAAAGGPVIFRFEDWGGVMQLPFYGQLASTSGTYSFQAYSFNPQRYAVWRKLLNGYLSKYGAS